MKYYNTTFKEYLKQKECYNIHNSYQIDNIRNMNNIIIYGKNGSGKYSHALDIIKNISKNNLSYEKILTYNNDKYSLNYKMSDIHFEIDFEFLGCNAKHFWNEIFNQIVEIITLRSNKSGVIICKNFDKIHIELIELFHNFMFLNNTTNNDIIIRFILLTNTISFIPYNILDICQKICLKMPNSNKYNKIIESLGKKQHQINYDNFELINIKESYYLINTINNDYFNIINDNIIHQITTFDTNSYIKFREALYDILIYNLEINECIYYILDYFISNKLITGDICQRMLESTSNYLKYYNNNYRPIYHIERIFYNIISSYHEQNNSM